MLVGPSKEKKNKRNEMALAIRLVAEMKNMTIRKPQRVKADVCILPLEGAKRIVIILFPNRFSTVPAAIV